jgi:hypothetical protein
VGKIVTVPHPNALPYGTLIIPTGTTRGHQFTVIAFFATADCDPSSLLAARFEDSVRQGALYIGLNATTCQQPSESARQKFAGFISRSFDAANTTEILKQKEWMGNLVQKSPYGWAKITKHGTTSQADGFNLPFPSLCPKGGLVPVQVIFFRNGLCISPEFMVYVVFPEFRYVVDWYISSLQNCSSQSFEEVWDSYNFNNEGDCRSLSSRDSFDVVRP